jgi:hypothetical protein
MMTEFKTIIITDSPGDMLDRQEYFGLRSNIPPGCLCPFCRQIIQQYFISFLHGETFVILQQNLTHHHHHHTSTGVPPYLLIQYPLFNAARKKNYEMKEINGS